MDELILILFIVAVLYGALKRSLRKRTRAIIPRWKRDIIKARDGYKCQHCGSHRNLQIDHIKPWSWGGSDSLWNLQVLCAACNRRKGAKFIG